MTSQVNVGSRASVEEYLVSVWSQALEVPEVSVHDDFFELGGDSLIALEVLAAIEDCLDTPVSVTLLYERPTIAELCDYIVGDGAE